MRERVKKILIIKLVLVVILLTSVGLVVLKFYGKILPGTYVLETDVSGLDKKTAATLLESKYKHPDEIKLIYGTDESRQEFVIKSIDINASYDFSETVDIAYKIGRSENLTSDLRNVIKSINNPNVLYLSLKYDNTKLNELLSVFAGEATIEPVYPSVNYENFSINVHEGSAGSEIDIIILKNEIINSLSRNEKPNIEVDVYEIDPSLSKEEVELVYERAQNILSKNIIVTAEEVSYEVSGEELISLITHPKGFNEKKVNEVVNSISEQIDRPAQNPTFTVSDSRVTEFKPALNGISVDKKQLALQIVSELTILELEEVDSVEIAAAVKTTEPEFQTSDVNNLGIRELIGKGESYFRGSIPSRVYNLSLAASRLNGYLIKPGEVFSFNNAVGDISKLTGYKEAYVIQDGKTILGDGGGVCQVSTTIFRAAMDAGLPIVERRAHAYRVYYYEQGFEPGLDATIYQPTTDFKFKNDTGNHILIQTETDPANSHLSFYFYGTDDGRISEISKPVITQQTEPPEDLYIDDPSLPSGQVKQTEHATWGAKVYFDYKVIKDGETHFEKTFYSNFRPWGNVFLRGTGPVQ